MAASDPAARAGDSQIRAGRDHQHANDSRGHGFVLEAARQGGGVDDRRPHRFGVHDFWRQKGIDRYCVAHESILEADESTTTRAVVTGVPLMPDFAFPMSQVEARRELNLAENVPVVLVLGGGLGLSVDAAAMALLQRQSSANVIVMPGKNNKARAALDRLAAQHPQRLDSL